MSGYGSCDPIRSDPLQPLNANPLSCPSSLLCPTSGNRRGTNGEAGFTLRKFAQKPLARLFNSATLYLSILDTQTPLRPHRVHMDPQVWVVFGYYSTRREIVDGA